MDQEKRRHRGDEGGKRICARVDKICAHNGKDAQSQAGRPLGITHLQNQGGVQDDEERGKNQERHEHPTLHQGEEHADRDNEEEAADAEPQGFPGRQQTPGNGAAPAAELSPPGPVVKTAPAVKILVENIDRCMGEQQPERCEEGVPQVERRAESSRFKPGNAGAENPEDQSENQKGKANNGNDALECHYSSRYC